MLVYTSPDQSRPDKTSLAPSRSLLSKHMRCATMFVMIRAVCVCVCVCVVCQLPRVSPSCRGNATPHTRAAPPPTLGQGSTPSAIIGRPMGGEGEGQLSAPGGSPTSSWRSWLLIGRLLSKQKKPWIPLVSAAGQRSRNVASPRCLVELIHDKEKDGVALGSSH